MYSSRNDTLTALSPTCRSRVCLRLCLCLRCKCGEDACEGVLCPCLLARGWPAALMDPPRKAAHIPNAAQPKTPRGAGPHLVRVDHVEDLLDRARDDAGGCARWRRHVRVCVYVCLCVCARLGA